MVLYDADCGFCLWALAKVLAWDRQCRLRPLALQDPAAGALLGAIDEERGMESWHLAAPDGELRSAGGALAPLLRLLPGGAALAPALERSPRLADRLYFAVAGRRSALGKLVSAAARARAKARVEKRERLSAGA
ncbi:MAG: DCC1-like thiol-disulfide oxidoreductase [Thermoleophilaceae bacterium]|nr:DCC1-like thiol-disulfide oxidoreductase [Thermoleophilaceae bacterium]